MSAGMHCCTWLLWLPSKAQVTEGYLPPLASCSKEDEANHLQTADGTNRKSTERRKLHQTQFCGHCRILGCLAVETYYYFYFYSIFCWDFLCNTIALLLVTAVIVLVHRSLKGPFLCALLCPFFFLGTLRSAGMPRQAQHKCSQASSSLGCRW